MIVVVVLGGRSSRTHHTLAHSHQRSSRGFLDLLRDAAPEDLGLLPPARFLENLSMVLLRFLMSDSIRRRIYLSIVIFLLLIPTALIPFPNKLSMSFTLFVVRHMYHFLLQVT